MFNRRQFLRVAALTSGASLIASRSAAQPAAARSGPASALPGPIAALASMKAQALPITAGERRGRIEQARRLMASHGLDAIILGQGTSLAYFSGMHWSGGERLFAMVLPGRGEAFYVAPGFEEDRAREQIAQGPLGDHADVRTWQEDENPYQKLAQGLKDRAIASGRLGIEERAPFVFSEGLAQASPAARIASATPVTAGCRMIKERHEIDLMRLAAQVTLKAYEAAYRSLRPGMTQDDFSSLVSLAHSRLGFSGDAGVSVGTYSALPHGSITPQVIREGTILLMDGGCSVEGYVSDISRTFVLGKPTVKMKEVFDIVHGAQSAALAAARPGVPCENVDAAARNVIAQAGYGPGYRYFSHRVGHGMGMDGHEWPYLVRGNALPISAGMVFSDEPGIYIRGEFGVRLEDDMHITENGAELFTPQSPSLEHPFG